MYNIRDMTFKRCGYSYWLRMEEIAGILLDKFEGTLNAMILLCLLENGGAVRLADLTDFVYKMVRRYGFKYSYKFTHSAVKYALTKLEEAGKVVVLDGAVAFSGVVNAFLRRRKVKDEDYQALALFVRDNVEWELEQEAKHLLGR